jgi:hypothetical protein
VWDLYWGGIFKGSGRGVSNRKWSSWFLAALKTASLADGRKTHNYIRGMGWGRETIVYV